VTHFIDRALLERLAAEARSRPRLRINYNFHPEDAYPAHRLLNAIEPGSWLPPHRHLDPAKDESIIVIAGVLGVILFDDEGQVVEARRLAPGSDCCGVDIPHGTWHTVMALAAGTVIFEAKAGPYRPLGNGELAPWAPPENHADAQRYAAELRGLFPAD
jgi:cupin fold WbuC family metalloprotein